MSERGDYDHGVEHLTIALQYADRFDEPERTKAIEETFAALSFEDEREQRIRYGFPWTPTPSPAFPSATPTPLPTSTPTRLPGVVSEEGQNPYFPLHLGDSWTYGYPSVNDPDNLSSEVRRVLEANPREGTYAVEVYIRLGTLPPARVTYVYDVRKGVVLDMGSSGGWAGAGFSPNIPAVIMLKPDLQKGMKWKDGPPKNMRGCEVLDFVTLKVPAGEFSNVAKIVTRTSFISSETGLETYGPTSDEYYAPGVGLIRVDVYEKDGRKPVYIQLEKYGR